LAATKRERIDEIMKRIRVASPFPSGVAARCALERIMKDVEDSLSGIPENPDAATALTDGRMYPPDDRFEIRSGSTRVRTFKQLRHRTSFGENGALQIIRSDGTFEINLCGVDGKTVADLLAN
jgi:hypothetical protein